MEYRVVGSFWHKKKHYPVGAIFQGDDAKEFLDLGLLSPIVKLHKIMEEVKNVPFTEPMAMKEVAEEKKSKKKGK